MIDEIKELCQKIIDDAETKTKKHLEDSGKLANGDAYKAEWLVKAIGKIPLLVQSLETEKQRKVAELAEGSRNIAVLKCDIQDYDNDMPCAYSLWIPQDVVNQSDEMGIILTQDEIVKVLEIMDSFSSDFDQLEVAINEVIDERPVPSVNKKGVDNVD